MGQPARNVGLDLPTESRTNDTTRLRSASRNEPCPDRLLRAGASHTNLTEILETAAGKVAPSIVLVSFGQFGGGGTRPIVPRSGCPHEGPAGLSRVVSHVRIGCLAWMGIDDGVGGMEPWARRLGDSTLPSRGPL